MLCDTLQVAVVRLKERGVISCSRVTASSLFLGLLREQAWIFREGQLFDFFTEQDVCGLDHLLFGEVFEVFQLHLVLFVKVRVVDGLRLALVHQVVT